MSYHHASSSQGVRRLLPYLRPWGDVHDNNLFCCDLNQISLITHIILISVIASLADEKKRHSSGAGPALPLVVREIQYPMKKTRKLFEPF